MVSTYCWLRYMFLDYNMNIKVCFIFLSIQVLFMIQSHQQPDFFFLKSVEYNYVFLLSLNRKIDIFESIDDENLIVTALTVKMSPMESFTFWVCV